jgi:biopolymer transport protein ExbB/TolQ
MIAMFATLIGVPRHFVIIGLVLLAVLGAGVGKCTYDRSVIRAHETKQEIKQVKRERKADTRLQDQKERDQSAADQRKKEIDDATKGIPDRAPSARQRAIACSELRREAKERGEPIPAC